jgi:hypothetical protein
MHWLKQNYDLSILGLGVLLIAASALLFVLPASEELSQTILPSSPARTQNQSAEATIEQIRKASALLESTPKISSTQSTDPTLRSSPFVSHPFILKDGKLLDPLQGSEKIHPPLDNAWIITHRLDYSDLGVKNRDPDGDGFSNAEEFQGKTDPNDPLSTPPSFTKLRLVQFTPIPFRLEFKGDPSGEGKEFQINLKDLSGRARTQYKKLGDLIEAGPDRPPYKIVSYEKKEGPNARGVLSDLSELTIENTVTDEKIILVYNLEKNDPASVGTFKNELNGEELTLRKDQEFVLSPFEATKFKVVDIFDEGAQIENLQTGEVFNVSKLETATPAPQ